MATNPNVAADVRMWMADPDFVASTRAVLRAQYDVTQEAFQAAGITHVPLVRGINKGVTEFGDQVVELSPLSSFSTSNSIAVTFSEGARGSAVITANIPVERIQSSWLSGLGCRREYEYVVLGSPTDDVFSVISTSRYFDADGNPI